MKFDDLRENLGTFWGSVSEGWDRMRHSAAGALTPEHDDTNSLRHGWFVLGGGSR